MSQKAKAKKAKKEQENYDTQQIVIAKVHDKKQSKEKGVLFLVELKGRPRQSHWLWKQQKYLHSCPGFKNELESFLLQVIQKQNNTSLEKLKAESKQQSKKLQQTPVKKLTIDKESLKQKLKMAGIQQLSLDKFVKSQTKQKIHQKNIDVKVQTTLPTISTESTQRTVIKIKKNEVQQQEKELAQKNLWIEKIKAIKMIKGYELKNNNLTYEAEVWDKNGQTLFVPPLSSEIVKKIDETKLAIFLQDCITRGACHESKGLLSGKL